MRASLTGALQYRAMHPAHEPNCDQQHTTRQPCNGALAPAEPRSASPFDVDPVEPQAMESGGLSPDDVAATAPVPQPTVYVSREWERTAAAVRAPDAPATAPDERARGGAARRAALLLVTIAVVLVTARGVRGRRGRRV